MSSSDAATSASLPLSLARLGFWHCPLTHLVRARLVRVPRLARHSSGIVAGMRLDMLVLRVEWQRV
jgi:hypothetical protein